MDRILSFETYVLNIPITRETLASIPQAKLFSYYDDLFERLVCGISTNVLTDKLDTILVSRQKTLSIEIPKNSWQQFKYRHQKAWWLRWARPVKMRIVHRVVAFHILVEPRIIFPEFITGKYGKYVRSIGFGEESFNVHDPKTDD